MQAGADMARAVKQLRRFLRAKPREQLQARYLLAHALLLSKDDAGLEEAAKLFAGLVDQYPLLADYCRYHGARTLYRLRRFADAEALAAAIGAASLLRSEAQLVRADALWALQREQEAAVLWRAYLRAHPEGGRVGQAYLHIGLALELEAAKGGEGAVAARRQALEQYKQVLIKAPLSRQRADAERKAAALAGTLPDGARLAALTAEQRFAQAMVYFRAQRNKESESAFAALAGEKGLGVGLRCKATYYQAKSIFKQRQRARAAPAFEAAVKLCHGAGEVELVVKSLYDGGRSLMNAKQHLEAIRRFQALEKEFGTHSYADDARLWAAEAYEALQKKEEAARLLSTLPERYPRGDMAHEALWRLARASYLEKKLPEALAHLDRSLKDLGRPRYYYALGQALYWKARIFERTDRAAEARGLYEQCIRDYPLSYYALLAFDRLRERHGVVFARLQKELIALAGHGRGRWTFAPRELFGEEGFLRGVELARLGFGAEAARELAAVGLGVAKGRADADLWLAAVLYDRAGLWHLSHQVPRSLDATYKRSYPLGEDYRRWAIAYPQSFLPIVRAASRRAGIPEELALAVMREESGFVTSIESYANAIGLMQLILPTARTAGAQHRLQVTRELLQDPTVNIKLGTTYLGFLHRTFGRTAPLAIAGYNGGEGAVYRWLGQFGRVALDEFIERIPYDQTRRYTKRVLSSLFVYSVLYGHGAARIPKLGQRLPRNVVKKAFGR